jgi:hypothetical protein
MTSQGATITDLRIDLDALSSLASMVHADASDVCVVCEGISPCELVLYVDHNYDLAAL